MSSIASFPRMSIGSRGSLLATREAYESEAEYGYRLLAPHLPHRGRILDVGAGLCLLASRLRDEGYDVTAVEPCASGFRGFRAAASDGVPVLSIGAEDLDPARHGTFDFIYSLNVLEHVADLPAAFRAMSRVLAPGGRMLHVCPNYAIPYENHFFVPLVPFFPRATAVLLPRRITETELWHGLNFVTAGRLRRLARSCDMRVEFERGTVYDAFTRLEKDAEFGSRQRVFLSAYRALKASGLLTLTRHIPTRFATPMVAHFSTS